MDRGRVVLIEAAHTCPPTIALGVAMAPEDASMLAEAPAANPALQGVHRHPGHGQRLEVATGGALGDVQLRAPHLLALLLQQEDGHRPVGSRFDNTARESGREVTGFGRRMAT